MSNDRKPVLHRQQPISKSPIEVIRVVKNEIPEHMVMLQPLKQETKYWDDIEKKIIDLFKQEIYLPLLKELGQPTKILNVGETGALEEAIKTAQISFHHGEFAGKFNAAVSKELQTLGAKWDRRQRTFKILQSQLPESIVAAIQTSEKRFLAKIAGIEKRISKMLPEKIADKLDVTRLFDQTLFEFDKKFQKNVEKITVSPKLTKDQRAKIADDWQNNMKKFIKDFTEEQIVELRKNILSRTLRGGRYEGVVAEIQKSYGVSQGKAKFLARQETSLMMSTFEKTKYQEAGSRGYIWGCVAGSKNHPVRAMHKSLEGKYFEWDNPPITNEKGDRNNPKEDYNCRCFARAVIGANKQNLFDKD